jgi:dihydrodipicolinate reductase
LLWLDEFKFHVGDPQMRMIGARRHAHCRRGIAPEQGERQRGQDVLNLRLGDIFGHEYPYFVERGELPALSVRLPAIAQEVSPR